MSTLAVTAGYAVSIVVALVGVGLLQAERTRLRNERLPSRPSRTVTGWIVTVAGLVALLAFTVQR